ncbi:MAG: hypothetical protein CMN32_01785, partial [Saprospirales bacterium]|nr:hypothetical protein [Saprospirales bacterium]
MNLSRLFILALIALSINQVKALAPCTGASTEIGGFVFRDYNANGVFDNSSNLQEVPMAGVTVSAYDDDDAPGAPTATATTDSLGTYLLTGLAPGTTYRLEFTWTFNWLKAGPAGGTTTQFAAAGSCNVDAAVNNPVDYCDSDPLIFTNCYVEHNQLTGANANMDVLVGMPYSSGNVTAQLPGVDLPGHTTLAVAQELGTTYGLAYQRSSSSIFAGAYMKRHSGFGPDSTGAIYRYDMVNDTVTTFVDLNALFGPGTTGADPHPNSATGSTAWQRDANSWDPVGKISLGDLDISEDELFLWTINLADRKLYKIPLASATAPVPPDSAAQISRYPANGDLTTLTGLNCANNATDVRPFGLGIKDGFVYVGIVCSAESTGNAADLKATVFKFDPVAETFSKVLEFPLNYNRGFAVRQSSFSYTNAEWNPWVTTFTVHGPVWNSEYTYPQPMLSDIVFDGEDMILGFRDRFGDQMGHDQLHPVSGSTLYRGDTAGDLLRASPNGSGGWTIENNAQSNPAGAFGPSAGAGTGQGPGNGEFYYQDRFTVTGTRIHDEVILGGLLHIAGWPDVAATQFDPIDDANEAFDGGIFWMDDSLGTRSRAYRVFNGGGSSGPTFGKSNGLGDLEAACDPAPIEIGNRVWDDADGDGIQDPSESGIPGVVVKLYKDTLLLDSTTTVSGGLYGFSSDSTGTTPGVKYGVYDLKPGMTYTLKIENYSAHPSIAGSGPTVADNGGSDAAADMRDNDAVANNGDAVITFTTGGAGDNNHNLDFGFGCPAVTLTFNVTKVSCPGETDGMIEVVVNNGLSPFDISWDNGAGTSGSVIDVPSPYTIDSLPVGDYTINVTDANGCLGTGVATVDNNPAPNPSLTSQSICFGDSATFDAGPGYASYFWSTLDTTQSITVSMQDTYFVAVTDSNGCTGVASATLVVHNQPTATIFGEFEVCPGDSLFLFADGGVSYLWNTGDTSQEIQKLAVNGAIYSVTVTDANGCTDTDSLQITVFPDPVVGISGNTSICEGDSTTLTATGDGIDWFWSNGVNAQSITISPPSTSNYALTITDDNDCPASTSVTVFVNPQPVITILTPAECSPDLTTWSVLVLATNANQVTATSGVVQQMGLDTFLIHSIPSANSITVSALDTQTGCNASLFIANPGCNCPVILPPVSNGDTAICSGEPIPALSVSLPAGPFTADWYAAPAGGTPLATGTVLFVPAGAGTYYAETRDTLSGCVSDSRTPVTLTIHPNPTAAISGQTTICEGDSTTLTASGGTAYSWSTGATAAAITLSPSVNTSYTVTVTDGNGCTATATATVTVLPNTSSNISASICEGDSYQFGQQILTQDGTYTQTFTAANGCDSVVNLTLTVLPVSNTNLTASICEGDSYQFGQQTLTQAGTYSQTFTAANGCDSVVNLTLTVLPVSNTNLSASICEGDSYQFGQQTLTQAGTYSQTFTAANGCDSVVNLTLTVLPVSNTNLSASICEGDSYQFGQQILTQAGTYSQTFTAANGCDSVVNLTLTVLPVSNTNLSASICEGESYQFGQQTLTQAGTYTQTFTAANGCDSVVNLTLTVLPVSNTNLSASICEGDSYQFGQQTLTQAGTYSQTFTAANGCDSVVNLTLTVLPVSNTNLSASICEGESYQFGQQTLTQAGTYSQTFTAANG